MDNTSDYLDPETAPPGLRERKRIATQCAIEDRATRLVLERGYEAVTVEDICENADISKRTFFNYFETKDAAILGTQHAAASEELRQEFLQSDPDQLLLNLVGLFQEAEVNLRGRSSSFSNELLRRRKALMQKEPTLVATRFDTKVEWFHFFSALVEEYLTAHPEARTIELTDRHVPFDARPEPGQEPGNQSPCAPQGASASDEAIVITLLAREIAMMGGMRWMRQNQQSSGLDGLRRCGKEAYDLFHDVVKGLPDFNN